MNDKNGISNNDPDIGDLVDIPALNHKKGILRFKGTTEFGKSGLIWAGVELFTKEGKNDGSVGGKYYFNCEFKKGIFVAFDKIVKVQERSFPRSSKIATSLPKRKVTPPSSAIPVAETLGKSKYNTLPKRWTPTSLKSDTIRISKAVDSKNDKPQRSLIPSIFDRSPSRSQTGSTDHISLNNETPNSIARDHNLSVEIVSKNEIIAAEDTVTEPKVIQADSIGNGNSLRRSEESLRSLPTEQKSSSFTALNTTPLQINSSSNNRSLVVTPNLISPVSVNGSLFATPGTDSLKASLQVYQSQNHLLKLELHALKSQKAKLELKYLALEDKYSNLAAKYETLQDEYVVVKGQMMELNEEVKRAANVHEELKNLRMIKQELDDMEEKVGSILEEREKLLDERDYYKSLVQKFDTHYSNFLTSEAEKEKQPLLEKTSELQKEVEITRLTKDSTSIDLEKIESIESRISTLKSEKEEVLAKFLGKQREYEGMINDLRSTNEHLNEEKLNLEFKLSALQHSYDEVFAELKDMKNSYDQKLSKLNEDNLRLLDERESFKSQRNITEDTIDFENEHNQIKKDIKCNCLELEEKLKGLTQEKIDLTSIQVNLEKDANLYKDKCSTLEVEILTLKSESARIQQKSEIIKDDLDMGINDLTAWRAKFEGFCKNLAKQKKFSNEQGVTKGVQTESAAQLQSENSPPSVFSVANIPSIYSDEPYKNLRQPSGSVVTSSAEASPPKISHLSSLANSDNSPQLSIISNEVLSLQEKILTLENLLEQQKQSAKESDMTVAQLVKEKDQWMAAWEQLLEEKNFLSSEVERFKALNGNIVSLNVDQDVVGNSRCIYCDSVDHVSDECPVADETF